MSEVNFQAEIITPRGIFYSEKVCLITLPGIYGEFGIMPGHAATLIGLSPGLVTVYDAKIRVKEYIFVAAGFVEITESIATILVEEAEYLSSYNLKDTERLLSDLKIALSLCKEELEEARLQKDIQLNESLLYALKATTD